MRRALSRAVWIGVVALLLALLVYGFWPRPLRVDVAKVRRGPFAAAIEVDDARTRVRDRYRVSAPVAGEAERIELDPGAAVHPGTLLVRIVPLQHALLDPQARAQAQARAAAAADSQREAQVALDRATTSLQQALRDLERTRNLMKTQAVTRRDLELAENEVRLRRADVARARFLERVAYSRKVSALAELGRLRGGQPVPEDQIVPVTSPVEGQVLRVLHESAGPVSPGTPLLDLGDLSSLEIYAPVLTRDAPQLRPGMRVEIDRWGGPAPLRGWLLRMDPSAYTKISPLGTEEQRVDAIVQLETPRQQWLQLGDGFEVEARFITWEGDQVLQAPASAVFRGQDGWAAFVVRGGKARRQRVEPGHRSASEVEIRSGLAEGDTVVAHPPDALKDGARVRPR